MDPFEGIHLEVISGGKVLDLYNDQDEEPGHDSRVRQRYVEAVTGATFQVRLKITDAFELSTLHAMDAIRVSILYDGQWRKWYNDMTIAEIRSAWFRKESPTITFSRVARWCDDTRQWRSGETTFGALVMGKYAEFALRTGR